MKYLAAIFIFILLIAGTTQYRPYDGWLAFVSNNLSLGATSFPTSLDSFTNPSATDKTNNPSHSTQHSNANDAIEALQAKVGANSSAVTTSHDYKLSGVTGSDVACSLTGVETLTNKTLTSPNLTGINATNTILWGPTVLNGTTTITLNSTPFTLSGSDISIDLGSDATGDLYYRNSLGAFTRLPVGSNSEYLQVSSGLPSWQAQAPTAPSGFVNATSSASTTLGFNVDGTDFVQVFAYGTGATDNATVDIQLKLGQVTVDSFSATSYSDGELQFYLTYFGTPAATSTLLSVTESGLSSLDDVTILYYKY